MKGGTEVSAMPTRGAFLGPAPTESQAREIFRQGHRSRTRYTEDIPTGIQPVITEHAIYRAWCPRCWKIVEVFNYHLQLKLSTGALTRQWYRLQALLYPWYEQIQAAALASAVLHADETSWRVAGKTCWLWCFAATQLAYFTIDRVRGSPALKKFFTREFQGTLVSDFWGAYNKVRCARRQMCLVHLLRDFLDQPDVPFDNNHGERSLRPAVIIRKNSYCNRSQRGSETLAVLMSIYRTLKQRGHDPIATVIEALETYLMTGKLPPLPNKVTGNG